MYELKRSETLKIEVKIGEEVVTTDLNLSKHAQEVIKLSRELKVIQANLQQENDIEENLIKLGELTIKLIKIFFNKDADKVLKFYSDPSPEGNERTVNMENTEEILIEVVPFLFSLLPQINEFTQKKQDELKKSIKGRKVV